MIFLSELSRIGSTHTDSIPLQICLKSDGFNNTGFVSLSDRNSGATKAVDFAKTLIIA